MIVLKDELIKKISLKEGLYYLYYKYYNKHPIINSTFSDDVILTYSKIYCVSDIKDLKTEMLVDAYLTQEKFPNLLEGMNIESNKNLFYYVLKVPSCFYLPYILFVHDGLSLGKYDFIALKLKEVLYDYWVKDSVNLNDD